MADWFDCARIKRSDAVVAWDDPEHPKGNRQKVRAHDLTEDEVESVLQDDDARVVPNLSHPDRCRAQGYTHTDRWIVVIWEILDDGMPLIRPITAYEPSESWETP